MSCSDAKHRALTDVELEAIAARTESQPVKDAIAVAIRRNAHVENYRRERWSIAIGRVALWAVCPFSVPGLIVVDMCRAVALCGAAVAELVGPACMNAADLCRPVHDSHYECASFVCPDACPGGCEECATRCPNTIGAEVAVRAAIAAGSCYEDYMDRYHEPTCPSHLQFDSALMRLAADIECGDERIAARRLAEWIAADPDLDAAGHLPITPQVVISAVQAAKCVQKGVISQQPSGWSTDRRIEAGAALAMRRSSAMRLAGEKSESDETCETNPDPVVESFAAAFMVARRPVTDAVQADIALARALIAHRPAPECFELEAAALLAASVSKSNSGLPPMVV